jgi:CubicO group peptidase (beta-lactamase class C family)
LQQPKKPEEMKKFLYAILIFCAAGLTVMLITDTSYLISAFRTVWMRGNTDVTIDDYQVQPTKTIQASNPQPWKLHDQYNRVALSDSILKYHKEKESIAFLIVKDGQLLTEKYFNEGSETHLSCIWSITKTYTSLLLLKAVEDGLIASIDDPVKKYIPELNLKQQDTLTLRHLASMSAGLYWDEWSHKPQSLITKLNFYGNLEKFTMEDMYAIGEPGKVQHYNSGGTQMLGTVLKRVLGKKSISDYLSEKFWQPLGFEHDGLFVLDSKKHENEKAFGGIVSTARNVSKLGQLILNEGVWDGKQILSDADMQLIQTVPYHNTTYTFGLWTGLYEGSRFYYQSGFGGQLCITFPKYNIVITRLGHKTSPRTNLEDVKPDTYELIAEALRIVQESGL